DVADLLALLAGAVDRLAQRAVGRAPADEEDVAFLVAVNFGAGQRLGQSLQFFAPLRRHLLMLSRVARRMTELVMFETGDGRIGRALDAGAGRGMAGDGVDRV